MPAGQISQRTLDFLSQLRKPVRERSVSGLTEQECNDRDWFQSNDATFRAVEREWNAFVGAASEAFTRGDWTLPVYPAKNLVYRIYRDVRCVDDVSYALTVQLQQRQDAVQDQHERVVQPHRSQRCAALLVSPLTCRAMCAVHSGP